VIGHVFVCWGYQAHDQSLSWLDTPNIQIHDRSLSWLGTPNIQIHDQSLSWLDTPNIQIHDQSLSWLGTSTSLKSGEVKLVLWDQTSPDVVLYVFMQHWHFTHKHCYKECYNLEHYI
jgi:hypothetical protein